MREYVIVADSHCHIPLSLLQRWGVSVAQTGEDIDCFVRSWEDILLQERDILCVSSSAFAGRARSAAAELEKKWPRDRIRILPTRTAGGLPVYLAVAKAKEGAGLEENFRWLCSLLPQCLGCSVSWDLGMGKRAGRKAARILADQYGTLALPERNTPVFISHAQCCREAEALADLLMERYGVEVTLTNRMEPETGDSATLALFFLGQPEGRKG